MRRATRPFRILAAVSVAAATATGGAGAARAAAPGVGELARARQAISASDATAGAGQSGKLLRYVALGDSVPYGHGLANPDKNTESGLPPDQGPSPFAWPSLVQKALHGLAPVTLRPTSCTLTGSHGQHYDQLAISGAPTQPNQWTGPDNNCHYPKGVKVPLRKAVVPNEIDAADLAADPPALVTIQAGADTIDFSGCLEALLGFFPSQAGADRCVTH